MIESARPLFLFREPAPSQRPLPAPRNPGAAEAEHPSRPRPEQPGRPEATTPAARAQTTFERFEFKYWVTERTARELAAFVAPWLAPDPHRSGADLQRNVSLYLDSRGFRFFEEHVSGAPDRIKLRVRGYGDPPAGSVFFEVKRKVKSVSLKQRAVLPLTSVRDVLEGRILPGAVPEQDRAHLERFVALMLLHRAEPRLFVGCRREAFVARHPGEDVRMTFDRDLVWQPASERALRPAARSWRPLTPAGATTFLGRDLVLLELKFLGRPPVWMDQAVSRFRLVRQAFSKYVTAVTALRDQRRGR